MLRIVHVITGLTYGGAERLLLNLCVLQEKCFEIHIIYLKDEPFLASSFPNSVTIHHAPLGRTVVNRVRQIIKKVKPDIVHTHLGHGDFIGFMASAFLPVRRFCTMHNIWFKWNWKDRIIFAAYRLCFATIARSCEVICISRSVEDHVRDVLGVPNNLRHLVYNAIPDLPELPSLEKLRNKLNIPLERFCVLFIGRLEAQKSVDTLLHAFAALPANMADSLLLIVGEGRLRGELEALAAELGLGDRVEFRGTTAKPEEYFATADVFVLPSVFEGLGIVILEAFRATLPVIATCVEGPAELIQDGRNGLLFTPRDHLALRNALVTLHADPTKRSLLAQEGHKDYRDRFTIRGYAETLASLYERF